MLLLLSNRRVTTVLVLLLLLLLIVVSLLLVSQGCYFLFTSQCLCLGLSLLRWRFSFLLLDSNWSRYFSANNHLLWWCSPTHRLAMLLHVILLTVSLDLLLRVALVVILLRRFPLFARRWGIMTGRSLDILWGRHCP